MSAPGGGWFGRRNVDDAALAIARTEKGTAAMTLLELDTVQRTAETQVQAYLDYAPGEAQRFSQSWAPVQSEANGAITHYLEVAGEHDVDLELEAAAAKAAANAYNAAGARMHAAALAVTAFAEKSEPRFEKVRIASTQFERTMREVDGLLTHAEQAVATAGTAGLRTVEPEALLAQARAEVRTAREGVSVHGLRAANDAASDAAEHARAAATAADGLEERAAEIAQRLSSTRTRLQVSRERTRGTDTGLSELRKRFSAGASDDLADVGEQVSEHLAAADRAVRTAATLSEQQRWADAESALAEGRSAVVTAEGLADRVRTRLAELDAVIADPRGPLTAARRAVRDAQRFLLELAPELEQGSDALPSANPYARAARTLDSLAERAVAAEDELAGRDAPGAGRVDHWEWLHELAGLNDAASSVVAELRERQAR